MATVAPVFVELIGDGHKLTRTLGTAQRDLSSLGKHGSTTLKQMAVVGKAAFLGIGGAALVVGGLSLRMADNFERSHARLVAALKSTGHTSDEFKGRIAAADKTMTKFGYTNTQTENALAIMTVAMRSPTKALERLQVAADLAKLKNIDLADAASLVAKAQAGQLKGVKALGLDLNVQVGGALKAASAQKQLAAAQAHLNQLLAVDHAKKRLTIGDHYALSAAQAKVHDAQRKLNDAQTAGNRIVDTLAKAVKGQAAAAADTFAGKLDVAKARVENMAIKIGLALIPVIERAIAVISAIVGWFARHKTIAEALAIVIGGVLVAAIGAWIYSMLTATITIGAFEVAAAPVIAIVLAIIAVVTLIVVAILELIKHWRGVWGAIKAVALDAWAFLRPVFMAVWRYGLQPIWIAARVLGAVFSAVWRVIAAIVSVAWSILKPIFKALIIVALLPLALTIRELELVWRIAWVAIHAAVRVAWSVLRPIFGFIVRLGLMYVHVWLLVLKAAWTVAWSVIHAVVSTAWSILRPVFTAIKRYGLDVLQAAIYTFGAIWHGAWQGIQDVVQAVWRVLKPIVDAIINSVGKVVGAVSKIAGIAGKIGGGIGHFVKGAVPGLAAGGLVTRPTLALIGEGSEPEAVVPLSKLAAMSGGGGVTQVNVYLDGKLVHRSVQTQDKRYQVRNGRSALAS